MAEDLWPEVVDEQAAAAVRSTLWRLRRICGDLLRMIASDVEQIATSVDLEGAPLSLARLVADFAAGRALELSLSR